MRPRVLVSRHVYPAAIELLEREVELDYHDSADGLGADGLKSALADRHGLVCQLTDPVGAELMDAAPGLRVIANVAVGFDNIDVPAATARGIVVTNTPGVLTETTADFAFALLMATARRITEAERYLRAGRWRQWEIDMLCGHDIHGHTLGILGFGRIGRSVARRARGFDMRVRYHDAARMDPAEEQRLGVEYVDRETLFRQSDFVSVHVPLTPQTRHAVGARELDWMPQHAILINTARGPVVDEEALVHALERGSIAGAGLDVYELEPAVHEGLLAQERVVLAPHIASASIKTRTRMCTMAAENALAVLRGARPPNPVNPEVLER